MQLMLNLKMIMRTKITFLIYQETAYISWHNTKKQWEQGLAPFNINFFSSLLKISDTPIFKI